MSSDICCTYNLHFRVLLRLKACKRPFHIQGLYGSVRSMVPQGNLVFCCYVNDNNNNEPLEAEPYNSRCHDWLTRVHWRYLKITKCHHDSSGWTLQQNLTEISKNSTSDSETKKKPKHILKEQQMGIVVDFSSLLLIQLDLWVCLFVRKSQTHFGSVYFLTEFQILVMLSKYSYF